jgi:hypothetical protein
VNKDSKTFKTSISLPGMVMGWGKELMLEKGFGDNFSSYLADLIRHDKGTADAAKRILAHDAARKI